MHFLYLITALKIEKKIEKTRTGAKILETAGNIANYSKFQPKAQLSSLLQRIISGFKLSKKNAPN